ncbi:MAG: acyl-CoA thioesterase [Oscillospiraceae bacterium]|nr:acyl-CoA thioesterase [Oscillospiraceae bacterium]MDD3832972.1 acyl-CoA thioesterase [Oscillospiraceae bacterium]MDD4546486.1 acyl-CoA thioesterase [Oscillospiraceae bacterium]
MEKTEFRYVADSRTQQVQIVLPQHANAYKRLFGGVLMQWIDVTAAVTARRHSCFEVTTARIDMLEFVAPAYVGSTVLLDGCITHVGTTSMEVRVDTYVESLDGNRERVNRAYLVLVALDEQSNPVRVPRLTPVTQEEQDEWQAGIKRRALRKKRRVERY